MEIPFQRSRGSAGSDQRRNRHIPICSGLGVALILVGLWTVQLTAAHQQVGSRHHFYLSDKRIITIELIDRATVILNYINLSPDIEFVRAPYVLVYDAEQMLYRGHVIEAENPSNPLKRYQVSEMIRPGEFKGYTILGQFNFIAPPVRVLYRVGSKIMEMKSLTADEFEIIASRIGELDLEITDPTVMIQFAGFNRGYGELHLPGSEKSDELSALFPDLELLPPILISEPRPRLPRSEQDLPEPVLVQLSAAVGRSGGIFNLKVKRGVNKKLDKLALEFVQNSWKMLPAIAHGKVTDSEATLNVRFTR